MPDDLSDAYHVRPLVDGSESDFAARYVSVAGESLLNPDPQTWETYLKRIGRENVRGVFAGDELVGGLAFYRTGQWFGGREISCAGVSGVAVTPPHRGTGACGLMMRHLLRELYAEGVPVSSLYASTQRLYRQCGYAQAGFQTKYGVPLSRFSSADFPFDRELPLHRYASIDSAPPLTALRHADAVRAKQSNGQFRRTDGLWQRLLEPYDGQGSITYLFGDPTRPEGYVILRPGSRDLGVPQPLVANDVVANTPRALGRLAALLYDHRSMHDDFQFFGSPADPLILFSDRSIVHIKEQLRWLLRIIHLPAAMAGRGYPAFLTGQLHLHIKDPLINENDGRWVFSFHDGSAEADRGGDGLLELDIDWLAPLFTSYMTPDQLISLGKLKYKTDDARNKSQLELLSTAFAGPAPWMPELF